MVQYGLAGRQGGALGRQPKPGAAAEALPEAASPANVSVLGRAVLCD